MKVWKTALLTLSAATILADEPVLTAEPRELRGVPGEPLRVELTVKTDRANPIQLRIPAVSNLILRTAEKIPITRTAENTYVQKRIIIWQGVEAGSITLTNLTAVFQGLDKTFPMIEITIDAVKPADPPLPAAAPPMEGNKTSLMHNPLLWRSTGTVHREGSP